MRRIADYKLQCAYCRKPIKERAEYNQFFSGSMIPAYHSGRVHLLAVLGMYTIAVHINCSYTIKKKEIRHE